MKFYSIPYTNDPKDPIVHRDELPGREMATESQIALDQNQEELAPHLLSLNPSPRIHGPLNLRRILPSSDLEAYRAEAQLAPREMDVREELPAPLKGSDGNEPEIVWGVQVET
ncbi:UNVERIFIED_CONTAM: hypothetical protein K2H54_004178 [Gekko kuhli]